jgi:hypothetical protein
LHGAKEHDQVGCLIPHLVEGGFLVMQYADDTILFMEHNLEKAVNMQLILCIFEQLSVLKINFYKKGFLFFGKANNKEQQYKQMFGWESG